MSWAPGTGWVCLNVSFLYKIYSAQEVPWDGKPKGFFLSDGSAGPSSKPSDLGSSLHEQPAFGAGQHQAHGCVTDGVEPEVTVASIIAFAAKVGGCACRGAAEL